VLVDEEEQQRGAFIAFKTLVEEVPTNKINNYNHIPTTISTPPDSQRLETNHTWV
jgi:hypothetical protein